MSQKTVAQALLCWSSGYDSASTAGGMGSIPGKGSSTCHMAQPQEEKKKDNDTIKKNFTTHVTEIIS